LAYIYDPTEYLKKKVKIQHQNDFFL